MFKQVAIVGAGPAGCALACFLRQRDIDCIVYDNQKTPELLVGESLVPAVIPLLRRLGIEQRVAEISRVKRGAALRHNNGNRVDFEFQKFGKKYPNYSYNIPRPQFDQLLKQRAKELGVKFVNHHAKLERVQDDAGDTLKLSSESLLAAGLNRSTEPDLLIDASGRARVFSRALNIPAQRGPRNDVAHFAHYENFAADNKLDGQVVLTTLESGWSWQIPLPDVTSVGVVLDSAVAKQYGQSPEQRLENVIAHNRLLSEAGRSRKRVSPVKTYSNYQLFSERAHGNGWILLGDALGFVDPMLSPGVFMSLESASLLDKLVIAKVSASKKSTQEMADNCAKYYAAMRDWHQAWSRLIGYFYDGRILSMGEMRDHIRSSASLLSLSKYAETMVSRSLSQLVSGAGTRSEFNQAVLHYTTKHLIKDTAHLEQHRIASALSPAQLSTLEKIKSRAEVESSAALRNRASS